MFRTKWPMGATWTQSFEDSSSTWFWSYWHRSSASLARGSVENWPSLVPLPRQSEGPSACQPTDPPRPLRQQEDTLDQTLPPGPDRPRDDTVLHLAVPRWLLAELVDEVQDLVNDAVVYGIERAHHNEPDDEYLRRRAALNARARAVRNKLADCVMLDGPLDDGRAR